MNGIPDRAARVPRRLGLAWRRGLALPFAVGVVQLLGTAHGVGGKFNYKVGGAASKTHTVHLGLALNPAHPTVLD